MLRPRALRPRARERATTSRPVTVVAIGAADLEPGEGLSGPVAAAVERATTLVLALVDQLGATGPDT